MKGLTISRDGLGTNLARRQTHFVIENGTAPFLSLIYRKRQCLLNPVQRVHFLGSNHFFYFHWLLSPSLVDLYRRDTPWFRAFIGLLTRRKFNVLSSSKFKQPTHSRSVHGQFNWEPRFMNAEAILYLWSPINTCNFLSAVTQSWHILQETTNNTEGLMTRRCRSAACFMWLYGWFGDPW